MKKLYVLILSLTITTLSFGQEIMLNGNFESWDNATTPTSYSKAESTEQETTEVHGGANSAKHTGGTKDIAQTITGIIPGSSYTISLWYKVASGDATSARIWSYWQASGSNITDNANELRGPNNAYLSNNGGAWTQYTTTITAPATADGFYFEVRTYSGAVIYWDDFSVFKESVANPALSIISPGSGDNVAGPNVDVTLSIQNFNVANGTGDGHINYSVDGGTSISKYDTDPISLTGLSYGSHTVTVDLVDNSNAPLSTPLTATSTFTTYQIQTLPTTESFTYTAAENLADQSAWTNYFSGDEILVESGNLSYSGLAGTGNSISFDGGGKDPVLNFTPTSSGTLYASFMLKVSALDASAVNGYFGVLRNNNGDYISRLWISPTSATSYRIGISSGGTLTQIHAPTTDYALNETIFVVFNYDLDNNSVSAWINKGNTTAPTADITEASTFTSNTLNQFLIRQDSATETPSIVMDELRIGATWTDVVPSSLSATSKDLSSFNLYPNPSNGGFVNIISNKTGAIKAQVFDVLVKQVLNEFVMNRRLNVSSLNTGIYIIKLKQGTTITTKKLIVQ
ncbi:T9SS type A sorting domain-containing protein [Flavobacteriaceae bacterium]|nr:T9SS type A sorting domain-containing protein [Flavobacteriaceae bacterium]